MEWLMKVVKRVLGWPGSLMDGVEEVIDRLGKSRGKFPHPKIKKARKILEKARDLAKQEISESERSFLLLAGLNHASKFLYDAIKDSNSPTLARIQEYVLELYAYFSAIHRR